MSNQIPKTLWLVCHRGSVLGPLLFLLYINDIVNSAFQGETVIFADDTNIFVTGNNEEKNLLFSQQSIKMCFNIYES